MARGDLQNERGLFLADVFQSALQGLAAVVMGVVGVGEEGEQSLFEEVDSGGMVGQGRGRPDGSFGR